MKLHLGCGAVTPVGWVNLDGSWNAWAARFPLLRKALRVVPGIPKGLLEIPWSSRVVHHDVRKRLPFPDGSAEVVYASPLFDFVTFSEAKRLLKECHRVLKPGGVLRIVVEDIRRFLQEYLEGQPSQGLPEELMNLPAADRLMARLLCQNPESARGGILYRFYLRTTDLQTRKWAYDAESLEVRFREAGFTEVSEMPLLKSRIPGIEQVEKSAGICVEGIRPR